MFCTLALALLGLSNADAATPADSATQLDDAAFVELSGAEANRTPTRSTRGSRSSTRSSSSRSGSRSAPATRRSTTSRQVHGTSRPSTHRSAPRSAPATRSNPQTRSNPHARSGRPSQSARPQTTTRPASSRPGASARPPRPGTAPRTASRPASARPPARPGAARPPASRPGAARPPARPARPAYRPPPRIQSRPSRAARPGRTYTYARPRYYVRPHTGIFVYGPRPVYHRHYHVNGARPAQATKVQTRHLPTRKIDRDNSLAVGLKAGSYFGAYQGANSYADLGLGLNVRYRPAEAFGLEAALQGHRDDERSHTLGSASAMVFAFPWTRVSPYALGGVTYNSRSVNDTIFRNDELQTVSSAHDLFGVHGGIGIEFAVGKKAAIDLEARYIGYVNRDITDPTLPGAVTTSAGLMWHF